MKYIFVTAVLLALSSGRILLAADTVPQFKIESCRAAEETGSNAQACFEDEQKAKETLQQNWSSYDSSQKTIVSGSRKLGKAKLCWIDHVSRNEGWANNDADW